MELVLIIAGSVFLFWGLPGLIVWLLYVSPRNPFSLANWAENVLALLCGPLTWLFIFLATRDPGAMKEETPLEEIKRLEREHEHRAASPPEPPSKFEFD